MNDFSQRLHLYGLTPEIITELESSLITLHQIAVFTCVSSGVSLQVKGVIEAFPTEGAEIPLDVTVTLHVSVKKSLKGESFAADPAPELAGVGVASLGLELLGLRPGSVLSQGIFHPVASIDQFQRSVGRHAELTNNQHLVDGMVQCCSVLFCGLRWSLSSKT